MEHFEIKQKKDMIYTFIKSEDYRPMKMKELAVLLDVPKEEKQNFIDVIEELVKEGKVMFSLKGKVMLPEDNMLAGTFLGTKSGFGFVRIEGREEDVFIPESECKDVMHGDTVMIQIFRENTSNGKRSEGKVVKILERKTDQVVGSFVKSRNFGFVVADNNKFTKDIFISKNKDMGAVDGHKVVVKLTSYGDETKNPEGEIVEILGHRNDPGVDILSIVRAYELPEEFPKEVMEQVGKVPYEISTNDMAGRVDLRQEQTVTIDGADAKDLDDAITLTQSDDGIYHLGVHIADVSHYVTEESPLDVEAINRATSVYLVDRVIPMLPHKLSNGICSLNSGTDRLALSCRMDFDLKGKLLGHSIAETVICVDERMNYSDVNDILTVQTKETMDRYEACVPMFQRMEKLAAILRNQRKKKGSIDFDFPECKIKLDEKGTPIDIVPYDRNVATRLIEEFMLAANQVVAEDYFWLELPFVYRTHAYPDLEKVNELAAMAKTFGYNLKVGNEEVHPREIQRLIEQIEGTDEEAFISRLTLRSMKRAQYSTENEGHFGLATQYYCHFTSPIRRYPDLQIHRIIKENIHGGITPARIGRYDNILPEIARISSERERRADDAEREVDKMKKAQYMASKIGEEFQGIISGVTSWGIYVELPNTVEGMVRLTDMREEHFEYHQEEYCVVGKQTGKTYRLGEKVKVLVSKVDDLANTIDFEFCREEQDE